MTEDPKSHGWLIHKRGRGWYRPDAKGYTPHPWEAGRYSHEEAMSRSHPNGPDAPRDGMTIKHESEVTDADGSLRSRLLAIDHGDGGSQWPRNPDGVEAWDCIQGLQNNLAVRVDALAAKDAEISRLEKSCAEWAEVSQGNYQAAKKAEAEVARLREALDPNFTKADYIGEFKFTYVAGRDDDGTEIYEEIYVPWTTIKEIMAAIRDRAALKGGDENGK